MQTKSLFGSVQLNKLWAFIVVFVSFFFSLAVHSAPPVTSLSTDQVSVPISVEYIQDLSGQLLIEDITNLSDTAWESTQEEVANFGYQAHPFWYRFSLKNTHDEMVNQIIEIAYPLLDSIQYYRFKEGQLVQSEHLGDRQPYRQRIIDRPEFLLPLALQTDETQTIYLKVQTAGSQLLPISLWQQIPLFIQLSREDELQAIYVGVVLVIAIFNLLIYIALREKMYLYYSLSTLAFMLFFVVMRARLYPFVFPDSPQFHHSLLLLLPPTCLLMAALFSREFLSLRRYSPKLNYVVNLIVFGTLLCMLGAFTLDSQTSLKLSVLFVIPGTFVLLLMGPTVALMGNRIAWVYTIAWGTLMFGATVTAMSKQGFLPANFATDYGMQLGSALEVFILNVALAYRFYREHEDKLAAQAAQIKENSERLEAEQKLLQSSMTHPVTLMPNRASFEQAIQNSLLARGKSRIAIGVIEITRYAEISKTLGHQNTDLMLCDIARSVNEVLANVPGIISIKGPSFNTFTCSLENASFGFLVDADLAETDIERVNNALRDMIMPIEFKGMRLEPNAVIGIAVCPEHGVNAPTLMRHAQVAADSPEARDKHLSYYRPEQDQYNARRLTMISELKDAIRNDELELFLQPKCRTHDSRVVGAEVLLRWHHAQYGTIRPDEFIPLAEQTGIIKPLTRWVVENALKLNQKLKQQGFDINIAINVSALNLNEDDLLDFLAEMIKKYDTQPEQLYIELTETSMMQNHERSIARLEQIRELGMKISIDDFGSGYSSLAYLKVLPADEIKLDRALVAETAIKDSNETVIRTTITMCRQLGFTVVAEGVETQRSVDRLAILECDLIQGYLLTPPLPFDQFIAWLTDSRQTS